jgi:hypothetical protein
MLFLQRLRTTLARLTPLSSGATPASRTEGERSETEVKATGVVACSELFGGSQALPSPEQQVPKSSVFRE